MIQPWQGADAARLDLLEGAADLTISVFPPAEDDLHREDLFAERYLVAMRTGHPAADNFNLTTWLVYPHILVSGRGHPRTPLDAELASRGLTRRIGLVVPNFQIVASLLRGSDLIAMLPSRVVEAEGDLISLPPPIPVPGFSLHLAWHRRRSKDAALRHTAGIIASILRAR